MKWHSIKNIKDTLIAKRHHWNVSDFTTINVSIYRI